MVEQIKLHIIPQPGSFPQRGGVREHLLQIYNAAANHPSIKLVSSEAEADRSKPRPKGKEERYSVGPKQSGFKMDIDVDYVKSFDDYGKPKFHDIPK